MKSCQQFCTTNYIEITDKINKENRKINMQLQSKYFRNSLFLLFSIFIINSCGNREETVSCFPNSPVSVVLNLNLPSYQNLQTVGGYIYINEQSSGTRGLIVVRTTNSFKVYDRNAPHICPGNNTTLEVKDNIKVVCPSDGAEWILITGEPIKISKVPPKTYPINYDSAANILSIYN